MPKTCVMVFFALTAALFALAARGAEPSYENKTLTQWLKVYEEADTGGAEEKHSMLAIRTIGTNAVPYLVKMLTTDDWNVQQSADRGFDILGPLGAPAVPALSNLLSATNEVVHILAAQSLGHIGAPALPALMFALTNSSHKIATAGALAIVDLGTNAAPAVPVFLRYLQSRNHRVRELAADALGDLHIEPQIVVPALTRLLYDPSPAARFIAIRSLGQFQTNAQSAIVELQPLLSDPDDGIRQATTNALKEISPAEFK
jgi:HEAT repeat protein